MNHIKYAIGYQHNYLESVGRFDREELQHAAQDNGADSVVRLCLWR